MLLCALGVHAQNAPALTCAVTVEIRDFDDYYPPGSLRREEAGEVIVAFVASPGSKYPRDIEVVRSSGFDNLDAAAFKLAKSLRVNSPCREQKTRWAVHFDYEPPEPRPTRLKRGCVEPIVRGLGFVLVVRDESEID